MVSERSFASGCFRHCLPHQAPALRGWLQKRDPGQTQRDFQVFRMMIHWQDNSISPCCGPPLLARSQCCSYTNKPLPHQSSGCSSEKTQLRTSLNYKAIYWLTLLKRSAAGRFDSVAPVRSLGTWFVAVSGSSESPQCPPALAAEHTAAYQAPLGCSHGSSDSHSLKSPPGVTDSLLNYLGLQAQQGLIGLIWAIFPNPVF